LFQENQLLGGIIKALPNVAWGGEKAEFKGLKFEGMGATDQKPRFGLC
jgi:hypothetical protein